MTALPKLHDRYVGRVVVATVLLTWSVLLGLDVVMAVSGEFSDIGTGDYGVVRALIHVMLTIPRRIYELFPTAAVIGALLGLGQLAASSELTALRAIGLSRRRLSFAVALSLAVLTLVMVANGETLAPWGQRRADAVKANAKSRDVIVAQYSGLWAREGDMFLNANSGQERSSGTDHWLELRDVRLYQFDDDGRLQSIAVAGVAEHRPSGWILHDVLRSRFSERTVIQERIPEERWQTKLDSTALAASVTKPRYLAAGELASSIAYFKRNSLDASEFEAIYWGRWFYPLNVLALCLAAVPFAFGLLRSGGAGKRLFLGIIFALGFYMLQKLSTNLAGVYKFDYRIAYFLPPAVMLAVSAFLFRRRSG